MPSGKQIYLWITESLLLVIQLSIGLYKVSHWFHPFDVRLYLRIVAHQSDFTVLNSKSSSIVRQAQKWIASFSNPHMSSVHLISHQAVCFQSIRCLIKYRLVIPLQYQIHYDLTYNCHTLIQVRIGFLVSSRFHLQSLYHDNRMTIDFLCPWLEVHVRVDTLERKNDPSAGSPTERWMICKSMAISLSCDTQWTDHPTPFRELPDYILTIISYGSDSHQRLVCVLDSYLQVGIHIQKSD